MINWNTDVVLLYNGIQINTVKDMKEQILEIAKDLEQGIITETEVQNLLLGLFGVIKSVCDVCESTTDKPTYKLCDKHYAEYEKFKQTVL